jgi:hypothetical protein
MKEAKGQTYQILMMGLEKEKKKKKSFQFQQPCIPAHVHMIS